MVYLVALLLSAVSIAVVAILIAVLAVQQVYAHIKEVKRLFIAALIAFIGIDMILLVRRLSPLDAIETITALRLMYSLTLYSAAAIGFAATIIYMKPKSSTWKDIYSEILRRMPLPFASFTFILLVFFILGWIVPFNVELRSCPTSYTDLYIPILETPHILAFHIGFIAFLSYPVVVFLLASYAAENRAVSRDLRVFASSVIGLGLSNHLQAFFLVRCFAETVDIIRIPCFIVLTYVFRRITSLQIFQDLELREYIEYLKRRLKL